MKSKRYVDLLVVSLLAMSPQIHCQEQLEQETISIRGNRGLPKTLYIAPWKRLGAPLEGKEFEGLVEDGLDPVERDLFQRELELYRKGYSVD